MDRADYLIQVTEGFKLGKLGAGPRLAKDSSQQKPEKIEIISSRFFQDVYIFIWEQTLPHTLYKLFGVPVSEKEAILAGSLSINKGNALSDDAINRPLLTINTYDRKRERKFATKMFLHKSYKVTSIPTEGVSWIRKSMGEIRLNNKGISALNFPADWSEV
jgi:hypothetical protein